MNALKILLALCLACVLSGCDMLGIETADKVAARQEAEGKAIGGACRQSGRALEDCYEMNRRAPKAAIFAGWRDMDGYMRENNIAVVKPMDETNDSRDAATKADAGAAKTAGSSALSPAETRAENAHKATKTS